MPCDHPSDPPSLTATLPSSTSLQDPGGVALPDTADASSSAEARAAKLLAGASTGRSAVSASEKGFHEAAAVPDANSRHTATTASTAVVRGAGARSTSSAAPTLRMLRRPRITAAAVSPVKASSVGGDLSDL